MTPRWRLVNFYVAPWLRWSQPENPLEELISTGNLRTVKDSSQLRYYGKSFVVPEDIAIQWVHKPTHCFGGECREFKPRIRIALPEYAHFRSKADGSKFVDYPTLEVVHDEFK